jgi:ribosomal-protein-alanine N-acetyltransferase
VTSAVRIRWATRDDLDAIARIQGAAHLASSWEPSSYLNYACSVAVLGDGVAGFLVSREVAPPRIDQGAIGSRETENGEREILWLVVDPANRRQGIGRALVDAELASCSKGTTWFLEVRESNLAAISLYTAVGFTASGRRPDYYSYPAEAAIVMRFFS